MRPNTRISRRSSIPLLTWAGALTISLGLWWGLLSLIAPEPIQTPCQGLTEGTDSYVECLFEDEELDLTPIGGN